MADRIQLRRDTAANWAAVNPILADGEIGLEQDTGQFKLGNGTLPYSALPYGGLQGPQGETGPTGPASTWGNIPGTLANQLDLQAALNAKAPKASPAFTGDASFAGAIGEGVQTLSGTAVTLDPSAGTVQLHVLTGATTYADGLTSGQSMTLMITTGSSYSVTWPALTWLTPEGTAPTLATTGATAIILWKVATTLYGAAVGAVA